MFHFFERKRLVRKGMASAKIRRRRSRSELMCTLETGAWVKGGIFLLFCIGLAMLIFYGSPSQSSKQFVISLLIFATALAQLWINHPISFASNSRITLMFGSMLLHLIFTKVLLVMGHHGRVIDPAYVPLIIPGTRWRRLCSVLLGKNQGLLRRHVRRAVRGSIIYWGSPGRPGVDMAFVYLL